MKNRKIIVTSIILLVNLIAAPVCVFVYYNLFIPDEYGTEYEQEWQSDDGTMTFVTANKKGLLGSYGYDYTGSIILSDEEKIEVSWDISSSNCSVVISNVKRDYDGNSFYFTDDTEEVFYGNCCYNLLFGCLKVEITKVADEYSDYFEVGDIINFRKC